MYYKKDGYCVPHLGPNVHERVVPQTSDRVFSDFTTDERRVLYDYVVSKTAGAVPQLKEFSLPTQTENKLEMTREQLMAAERDAKRRRVRYRSAKVHTKSKNYSEVMREVINNQMLAYENWLTDNYGSMGSSSSAPLEEKKTKEAAVTEKQEMIWLEGDCRINPHIRWKYELEKEKRRAERKDDRNEESNVYCHRRKEREERGNSRSRKSYQRDVSQKDRYNEVHRRNKYEYDNQERHKERKMIEYQKEHHDRDKESSSCRKDRTKYGHTSHKDVMSADYRRKGSLKKDRIEYEEDLRYRGSYRSAERKFELYEKEKDLRNIKGSRKYDNYHEVEDSIKIKRECNDEYSGQSDSADEYYKRKRPKSYESVRLKQEEGKNVVNDSDDVSSQYSSYSHAKKVKRKKKSKKNHKQKRKKTNKHNKTYISERVNQSVSSAESSDD